MSVSALPVAPVKLEVIELVIHAYRAVFGQAHLVLALAWLPFLLVLVMELVALAIVGDGFFGRLVSVLIHGIGFLVFGTVFLVRWHRFILIEEAEPAGLFTAAWRIFLTKGLQLAGLMLCGWVVLAVIALIPPHFLTGLLAVIGGFAMSFAAVRLSLVFPAAAIERPISFREAWDAVEGNYWRLLGGTILCYLPFLVLRMVVAPLQGESTVVWLIFEIIGLAISFAGIAVVATLLSEAYRRIVPLAPAPLPDVLPA